MYLSSIFIFISAAATTFCATAKTSIYSPYYRAVVYKYSSITDDFTFACEGTIVAPRLILTTASCDKHYSYWIHKLVIRVFSHTNGSVTDGNVTDDSVIDPVFVINAPRQEMHQILFVLPEPVTTNGLAIADTVRNNLPYGSKVMVATDELGAVEEYETMKYGPATEYFDYINKTVLCKKEYGRPVVQRRDGKDTLIGILRSYADQNDDCNWILNKMDLIDKKWIDGVNNALK